MEDEAMRITVIGAALIAAVVLGTALLICHLIRKAEQVKRTKEATDTR